MITVSDNLAEFNATLALYMQLSRRTPQEALVMKGAGLAFALSGRLRLLSPARGQTRKERLAALKAGGGVRVRPSVLAWAVKRFGYGSVTKTRRGAFLGVDAEGKGTERGSLMVGRKKKRRMNLQALAVAAELSVRSRGRGYLAFAARMRWAAKMMIQGSEYRVLDRIETEVGRAGLTHDMDGSALRFRFANANIAEGLNRPKAEVAIAAALSEVRADMLLYINRKVAENARKAGLDGIRLLKTAAGGLA